MYQRVLHHVSLTIHVDTWLRKAVVILPILSLYTQQDAFTQSKDEPMLANN
jgi:hypothetical protein